MNYTSFLHPSLEVRTTNERGRGLFAKAKILKGVCIVRTEGKAIPVKEVEKLKYQFHPFQIEKDVLLAPFDEEKMSGIFLVNHSCDPNAGIVDKVGLISLREIEPNEEICYDYVMTDAAPEGVETVRMDCRCGSSSCRKVITDLDWQFPELQTKYKGYFSRYLADLIANHAT